MLCEVGVGLAKRTTPFFSDGVAHARNGRPLLQESTVSPILKLRQQQSFAPTATVAAAAAAAPKNRSCVSTRKSQRAAGVTTHAFGSAFQDNYEVSEPTKVNSDSLKDPPAGNADVIERMKQAFTHFKDNKFLKQDDLFAPLKEGQTPKVMIVACADSRVCPTMLMGLEPGEAFIVRNVANLVHPYEGDEKTISGESAGLLFAVTALGVEEIVIMGHRNCGGIKALMSFPPEEMENNPIGRWISSSEGAKSQTLINLKGKSFMEQCQYCELESVNKSLSNLLTFPFIKERFDKGQLGLHGMYYDFVDGELVCWKVKSPALVTA